MFHSHHLFIRSRVIYLYMKEQKKFGSVGSFEPLVRVTAELLDVCSQPEPQNINFLWSEHLEIRSLLQKVNSVSELGTKVDHIFDGKGTRYDSLEKFKNWCDTMSISTYNVHLASVNNECFGLLTTDGGVEKVQNLVAVPFKAMMSTDLIRRSPEFKTAMDKDPVVKDMPNVALALYLLNEAVKGAESVWEPYISVLPRNYNTPLYFSIEELELLKGSVGFEESLKLWRNIVRQFAYFSQLLATDNHAFKKTSLNVKNFTFNSYRWATVTVMTRVNLVPDPLDNCPKPTLIPFIDMANHDPFLPISLQYDEDISSAILCAARSYDLKGLEVCIFYGLRSNVQFLVHNGFIVCDNELDVIPIRFGLSKSDKLFQQKVTLLQKFQFESVTTFKIDRSFDSPQDMNSLLFFALVFNAGTLEELTKIEQATKLSPSDHKNVTFDELDEILVKKSYKFLAAKFELLINAYKVNEDAQGDTKNPNIGLIARFVDEERKILKKALRLLG